MVLEYQSQFGSIYIHMTDFPIERINRFFDNHIFEVYLQPTHDEDYSIRTNVIKNHMLNILSTFFQQMKPQTHGIIYMQTFMVEIPQLILPVKNMQILDG